MPIPSGGVPPDDPNDLSDWVYVVHPDVATGAYMLRFALDEFWGPVKGWTEGLDPALST